MKLRDAPERRGDRPARHHHRSSRPEVRNALSRRCLQTSAPRSTRSSGGRTSAPSSSPARARSPSSPARTSPSCGVHAAGRPRARMQRALRRRSRTSRAHDRRGQRLRARRGQRAGDVLRHPRRGRHTPGSGCPRPTSDPARRRRHPAAVPARGTGRAHRDDPHRTGSSTPPRRGRTVWSPRVVPTARAARRGPRPRRPDPRQGTPRGTARQARGPHRHGHRSAHRSGRRAAGSVPALHDRRQGRKAPRRSSRSARPPSERR